jgi:hypothetical protein
MLSWDFLLQELFFPALGLSSKTHLEAFLKPAHCAGFSQLQEQQQESKYNSPESYPLLGVFHHIISVLSSLLLVGYFWD